MLARHEAGVWEEARALAKAMPGGHRGAEFSARILPICAGLVAATGQRMAYEAAQNIVSDGMLSLYESTCLLSDPAWYCDNMGMMKRNIMDRDAEAVKGLLPKLNDLLSDKSVDQCLTAPILDASKMKVFVERLQTFRGTQVTLDASLPASKL